MGRPLNIYYFVVTMHTIYGHEFFAFLGCNGSCRGGWWSYWHARKGSFERHTLLV